ncbi:MAG: hypothetical protein ACI4L1_01085 [Christensenellales bacterium]
MKFFERDNDIDLGQSKTALLLQMSEGNEGTMALLDRLIYKSNLIKFIGCTLIDLDDMNMRGDQIWVAFHGYCKNDITKFLKEVDARSEKMVTYVNNSISKSLNYGSCYHKAVCSGAREDGRQIMQIAEVEWRRNQFLEK